MQAQKAKLGWRIVKKIGLKNLIWMTLFSGLVVVVLAAVFYTYRNVPMAHWREFNTGLPMKGAALVLENVEGTWKSSKGNARLELRTAYYPEVRLTLGSGSGRGVIYLKFVNSRRAEQGRPAALRYSDGVFLPANDVDVKAEGKTAVVLLERGFANAQDYRLHQLNEDEPLWRVQIYQRPADANVTYYLGETTIAPTAQ